MKTVLTIAGFDPSSGAGVTADLAVMASMGMFGTSCITALTVQSTLGAKAVHPVDAMVVAETLAWLTEDMPPAGIKIGMLANTGIVRAVSAFLSGFLEQWPGVPVVLDPVVKSSSGRALLDEAGVEAMLDELMPRVGWLTPNTVELGLLAGIAVEGEGDVARAARVLGERWPGLNIVGTGGHLDRPDDFVRLVDGWEEWAQGEWIESEATHGTGCAFSTSLLCGLVEGLDGLSAVRQAKEFVAQGMRRAERRGRGRGPMELYWRMRG